MIEERENKKRVNKVITVEIFNQLYSPCKLNGKKSLREDKYNKIPTENINRNISKVRNLRFFSL